MTTRTPFPRVLGNAGLVQTTAGNDLLHTMSILGPRSARLTKIMAYNNTGANVTLQFGTLNRNPAGAAFVALMPLFVAIDTLDNEWTEEEIPAVEWRSDTTPTAAGRTGDIYVLASAALVTIIIEVEEFGG